MAATTTTPTPFLLTGVTGGLGKKILHDMLHVHKIPPQDIIATARSTAHAPVFTSQNLQFRVVDFDTDPAASFANIQNLLFVSSSEVNTTLRNAQHARVIEAARKAGVRKIWYISLAFGGFGDDSPVGFQAAHLLTEKLLVESRLDFVVLRAGVYADAFPLWLNWYPSSKEVLLPEEASSAEGGKVAWASRDELGEGIATLLAKGMEAFPTIQPKDGKKIVLLTGPQVNTLVDLVDAIARARSHELPIRWMPAERWIHESAKDDEGGKALAWFEARLVVIEAMRDGDAELVDPALETVLGRRPETGVEAVERLVREKNGAYTWHQNHAN